ncbi:MAG: FkbM family methyltransferase, partial [Fervidicoccus fontis]
VGAFVGESSIYFVLKGAKKVIAVEPVPVNYLEMVENIGLNNAENKIIPVNVALGSELGSVKIKLVEPHMDYFRNTRLENLITKNSKEVHVYIPKITLGSIIDRFNIDTENSILKMDCEGCEFEVIIKDFEHVKLFNEIYFEYHTNYTGIPVSKLLTLLIKNYNCKVISTEDFRKRHGLSKEQLGLVYCKKLA